MRSRKDVERSGQGLITVLPWNLSAEADENHETLESGQRVSLPKLPKVVSRALHLEQPARYHPHIRLYRRNLSTERVVE
jgi:hypothetical protein